MYMMSTLVIHCQWEDETVREKTGHLPSYAEAKKIKSLALHTHDCLRASLRDCSSLLFFFAFLIPETPEEFSFRWSSAVTPVVTAVNFEQHYTNVQLNYILIAHRCWI